MKNSDEIVAAIHTYTHQPDKLEAVLLPLIQNQVDEAVREARIDEVKETIRITDLADTAVGGKMDAQSVIQGLRIRLAQLERRIFSVNGATLTKREDSHE